MTTSTATSTAAGAASAPHAPSKSPSKSPAKSPAKSLAKSPAKGQCKRASTPAIFIDGEAGTTGLEIQRRVAELAGIEVKSIPPEKRKDPGARASLMREVDLVVLCLP